MALSRNDGEALSATRKSVIHIHRPIAIAVLEMCRGGVCLPSPGIVSHTWHDWWHMKHCTPGPDRAVQLVAYGTPPGPPSTSSGSWETALQAETM